MRHIKITTLIGYSFDRTKLILFQPFLFKKWLSLLLIAYLAGALGLGSGGGSSVGDRGEEAEAAPQQQTLSFLRNTADQDELIQRDQEWEYTKVEGEELVSPQQWLSKITKDWPAWLFVLAGVGFLFIVAAGILFLWLSARFKFVWFNAIVKNVSSIEEPFKRYHREGDSVFKFLLVAAIIWIAAFLTLAAWGFHSLAASGAFNQGFEWSRPLIIRHFGFLMTISVISTTLWAVFMVCLDQFIVTIMAMKKCSFQKALHRFGEVYRENWKDLWIYLFVIIGLGILTGIGVILLILVTVLLLMLAGGILFGLPYLLIVTLLKAKMLYMILAVIAGIPFAVAALLLFCSLGLPFAVFFRSFSLYFLSSLGCGYEPLSLKSAAEGHGTEG